MVGRGAVPVGMPRKHSRRRCPGSTRAKALPGAWLTETRQCVTKSVAGYRPEAAVERRKAWRPDRKGRCRALIGAVNTEGAPRGAPLPLTV